MATKQLDNIRVVVLKDCEMRDPLEIFYITGIKWEGPHKWGIKGEGKTIEEATQNAVREFYRFLSDGTATDTGAEQPGS